MPELHIEKLRPAWMLLEVLVLVVLVGLSVWLADVIRSSVGWSPIVLGLFKGVASTFIVWKSLDSKSRRSFPAFYTIILLSLFVSFVMFIFMILPLLGVALGLANTVLSVRPIGRTEASLMLLIAPGVMQLVSAIIAIPATLFFVVLSRNQSSN